jgi:hypothetical protein
MATFTELGRQAYRDGLSPVIADNPVTRDLWPSVPAAQHRQAIRDYADGWAAEQRETNPAAALESEIRATEERIEFLTQQISRETHARALTRLRNDRQAARERLDQLVAAAPNPDRRMSTRPPTKENQS